MKTSPLISIMSGNLDRLPTNESGIELRVLMLCVMSSPTFPSPLVVAFSKFPFL